MYKIGLVGVGRWGEKIVRTILELSGKAKLVGVCQRTPKEISWIPKDCIVYDNVSDMLRKSTLTHIITAIDPDGHYDVVEKATKYGLPIWLEKPIALSYAESERIFALDGSIFVDYIHLYSECFQYLKNEVKDMLENYNIKSIGYSFAPNHKFSPLYDFATHDLSMLYSLLDNIQVKNVHYTKSNNTEHYNIQLTNNICNIFTQIGNDGRDGKKREFSIQVENNIYLYDGLGQKVFKNGNEVFVAKELPLKHGILAFLDGARVNREMSLKIMKTLDEIEARVK